MVELYWLPARADWNDRLRTIAGRADESVATDLVSLARNKIDFLQTNRLDRIAGLQTNLAASLVGEPVRLAVLGSSTIDHILPAIRVGGLRRSIPITTYTPTYGTYQQELIDPSSPLFGSRPTAVMFALDQRHLLGFPQSNMLRQQSDELLESIATRVRDNWRLVRAVSKAAIIQQTVMPVFPALIGCNEHRLPGSPQQLTARLNERLCSLATQEGVDILPLHTRVMHEGLNSWHDPLLWHYAKEEVSPSAAPVYGDLVARIVSAQQGKSAKCLVLDLDNTLWSGVIGNDGIEGIVLGQGSAVGEAHAAFQEYARELSRRGVLLAVCSKNDERNALEPFDSHPEMILRRADISCFVANWQEKAANIRKIAETLSISIDSLVFVDDSPFEREFVRRELPMVSVPELPADPALWAPCLADAGYFEIIDITPEDLSRTGLYQSNMQRESLKTSSTDLAGYLSALDMVLLWNRFDTLNLQRVVQLINKTNQFNLMTQRYSDAEVRAAMASPRTVTLQMRLVDRFGDNGIISLVIGVPSDENASDLLIDSWLMSCRVLGRKVEEATLNLIASEATALGYDRLVGQYRATGKNGIVQDHYLKLGFKPTEERGDGISTFLLSLVDFKTTETPITLRRA